MWSARQTRWQFWQLHCNVVVVQRPTCNVQRANGSCQVFLFVFHRPSRAAAIYLPSPRPGIARRPDAISVRSAAALAPSFSPSFSTSSALLPFMVPRPMQFMYFLLYYHLNLGLGCLPALAINSSSTQLEGKMGTGTWVRGVAKVLHKLWSCRFLWQTIKKTLHLWRCCRERVFNLKCKYKIEMQLQVGGGTSYYPSHILLLLLLLLFPGRPLYLLCTVPLLIRRTVCCTHDKQVINLGEIPCRPIPFGTAYREVWLVLTTCRLYRLVKIRATW